MRNRSQLKKMIHVWIVFLWVATAQAAQSSLTTSISNIPLDAIAWALALSGFGGIVATVKKVVESTVSFKNVYLEMFKDVLCSVLAGLFTFGMAILLELPGALQVVLIPLSGYAGSRLLERSLDNGLYVWFDRFFGAFTGAFSGSRTKDKEPQ